MNELNLTKEQLADTLRAANRPLGFVQPWQARNALYQTGEFPHPDEMEHRLPTEQEELNAFRWLKNHRPSTLLQVPDDLIRKHLVAEIKQLRDSVNAAKNEIRRRSEIFDIDEKEAAAQLMGLPIDALYGLSHEDWTYVRHQLRHFKDEAEQAFRIWQNGRLYIPQFQGMDDKTKLKDIWNAYRRNTNRNLTIYLEQDWLLAKQLRKNDIDLVPLFFDTADRMIRSIDEAVKVYRDGEELASPCSPISPVILDFLSRFELHEVRINILLEQDISSKTQQQFPGVTQWTILS